MKPLRLLPAPLAAALLAIAGCNSSQVPDTTASTSSTTVNSASTGTTNSAPTGAAANTEPAASTATDPNAPQRKPPAGKGNAIGQILYNGKPAVGIEVQLCKDISFISGCSGDTFSSKTDDKGYYVIDKVKPGDYSLSVRVFNTNRTIYPTSGILSAAKYKVEKDETLPVQVVNIYKFDLQTISPKSGATVEEKPKLSWKAYPGATKYKISIYPKEGFTSIPSVETSETSATPETALAKGAYRWTLEAYNGDDVKISQLADDGTFTVKSKGY